MNTMLHTRPIAWTSPSPFWIDADRTAMRRPAILRFASDDFMEEMQRVLARDPERLRGYAAVPETWRGIRKPAKTPNPAAGRPGVLARLGVAARRLPAPATRVPGKSSDAAAMDFKLYQPAHQRFYLVAATLVCQQAGLPDRKIDAGQQESAFFVTRRWFPRAESVDGDLPDFVDEKEWVEHAFVAQADGSLAWVPVAEAGAPESERAVALPGEERLPLFPTSFTEDDGRTRRMLAGLVPVGKREAYHAAVRPRPDGSPGGVTRNTARIAHFRKLVSEPWKALVEQARNTWKSKFARHADMLDALDLEPELTDFNAAIEDARGRIQLGSWFVLADLAAYLETYLPTVYQAIAQSDDSLTGAAGDVLRELGRIKIGDPLKSEIGGTVPDSLKDALFEFIKTVPAGKPFRESTLLKNLDNTIAPYVWPTGGTGYPSFLFPLADPELLEHAALPDISSMPPVTDPELEPDPNPVPPSPPTPEFDAHKAAIDRFAATVIRALETLPDQPEPAVPAAAERPADMRDGWFHLRCVYLRPACGPLHRDVVSAPSERFKLASFFDPDAPARPIRIGLPIDTTPAGLRKFDKNTAFVMSDILCGQVARLKSLTFGDLVLSVLPWPFHKDLPVPDTGRCTKGGVGIGLVCSLSIPIITICALILLLIIVSLLDFIFKWLPFLMVCFPLPGLRAKKS